MARECPRKGKGKSRIEKGAGKGQEKGKGGGWKGQYGKGFGEKGKGSGWKGGGYSKGGGFGKGGGKGKGFGYQGTCYRCGVVGHKAAECEREGVHGVEEGKTGAEENQGGETGGVGGVWLVAGVEEMRGCKTQCKTRGCRKEMTTKNAQAQPKSFEERKVEGRGGFMTQKGEDEERKPGRMTLDMWMPKKIELVNKYKIFQLNEDDDEDEDEEVAAVEEEELEICGVEEVNEVVEITVDSGAARSVWPKKKKGVKRRKIEGKVPKLAAANGSNIEVVGEAMLEFEREGRRCGMKFLDADVKKPLGAVSAMVEEGNTVVFSGKWGRYVESDATGERIPLVKKGGTYVMVLEAVDNKGNKIKKKAASGDGDEMDIDANDEDEKDKADKKEKGEETMVFRRRTLP